MYENRLRPFFAEHQPLASSRGAAL
jgi:hypothetical protein